MRLLAGLCALAGMGVAGTAGAMAPVHVPDDLIGMILEAPGATPGPEIVVARLAQAANAIVVSSRSINVDGETRHFFHLRVNDGVGLGDAFRAIQTYPLDPAAGWSLDHVGLNYYGGPFLPPPLRRVFNLSTRADARSGEGVTIGGIVLPGPYPSVVVFKVRGPSLAAFGIQNPLPNPKLILFRGQEPILENREWEALRKWEVDLARSVTTTPDDSREAMIVTLLDPGLYSAIVADESGTHGIALLEIYIEDTFRD